MTDPADLSKIQPPTVVPTDQDDAQTKAEEQELKKPTPKPIERELAARREHLEDVRAHAKHHQEQCEKCRQELNELRTALDAERQRAEALGNECVKLREISWSVGWMMLVGTSLVAVGSIGLGIAGSWPDLPDALKYALGGGGAATALCGVVATILAFMAGRRARQS